MQFLPKHGQQLKTRFFQQLTTNLTDFLNFLLTFPLVLPLNLPLILPLDPRGLEGLVEGEELGQGGGFGGEEVCLVLQVQGVRDSWVQLYWNVHISFFMLFQIIIKEWTNVTRSYLYTIVGIL